MSEETLDNQKIEFVEPPVEAVEESPEVTEDNSEAVETEEATESESPEQKPELEAEPKDKSLEELPLPGDEQESKSNIPKWVERKLTRKELEIQQQAQQNALLAAELERLRTTQVQPQFNAIEAPKRELFSSEPEWIAALVQHENTKAALNHQAEMQRQGMAQAQAKFLDKWTKAKDIGMDKYDDFAEKMAVLDAPGFPTNRAMCEAIVDTEHATDIQYFLASNPEHARKIAELNPVQAVKKIAELEARFNERKKKEPSKSPRPITPINTNQVKGATINSFLELSKNSEKMSQREFEKNMKALQSKKSSPW